MLAGGAQQAHEIGADGLARRQLRDHALDLHDVAGGDDRVGLVSRRATAEAREQLALAVLGGVADAGAHGEAVAGSVGHLERAGVVVRVHRADAEERLGKGVTALADGDGVLLHRLQQARLHARRRAVELVEHDGVREQRPGDELIRPQCGIGRLDLLPDHRRGR